MTVTLTSEQEQIVRDELATGLYYTPEEVIARALHLLRQTERNSNQTEQRLGARRQAVRDMLDFVEKNHTPVADVSVKDLIHEGHRL
ncbi:MAG: hypothetical protein DMG24_10730 [Acidobacteria bacterium]|nr:MAG: hypothetical protein DMG24_10730 [Acidobacteriota bacterium]